MVYVPAGPVEVPREHRPWGPSGVRRDVGAFYVDRTEVTVGAWRCWVAGLAADDGVDAATRRRLGAPLSEERDDMPVVDVCWDDAVRYAREARAGRLPTADEFLRALRGSGVSTWPWESPPSSVHANLLGLGPGHLVPVGRRPEGRSAFGLDDLIGNAAEWSGTITKRGTSGSGPIVLGGSFRDHAEAALAWGKQGRLVARVDGGAQRGWLGLRVVRDVPALPGD
jgi:formylglycine-generating enzyme required for sulfatase activity